MEQPSISVVIAAHNELENLKQLIPHLLNQAYDNYEIIVVLDRCNDGSIDFLKKQTNDQLDVIEIIKTPPGWDHKKYALETGIESSKKDWIAFTDADCHPFSDQWLAQFASRVDKNTKIILGHSPFESNGSFLQDFIQFEGFMTAFNYMSLSLLGKPYMGVGRNLGIERRFFKSSGGYADFKSLVGGDDDLFIQKNATKKNTNILVGKVSLMFTKPQKKWIDYIQQKTRHLSVGTKYSIKDQLLHLLLNGTLLLVWGLLPFLTVEKILPIILFYLVVKWIGYRFAHSKMGVGFNYILLPLVDPMYAFLLPGIAIRSKLVKDIRWKN